MLSPYYQERISNVTDHELKEIWDTSKAYRTVCKYSKLFLDRDIPAIDIMRKPGLIENTEIPEGFKLCFPCIANGKCTDIRRESGFLKRHLQQEHSYQSDQGKKSAFKKVRKCSLFRFLQIDPDLMQSLFVYLSISACHFIGSQANRLSRSCVQQ